MPVVREPVRGRRSFVEDERRATRSALERLGEDALLFPEREDGLLVSREVELGLDLVEARCGRHCFPAFYQGLPVSDTG